MDSAESTPPILETLRTVEFRLGLKGYNVDEVDEYLEKAAVEAEAVSQQLWQANERLRRATDRIAELERELEGGAVTRPVAVSAPEASGAEPVTDDALQRTLLLAQKFVDQTRRESEEEAAEAVRRADEHARSIIAEAEERARIMEAESADQLREEVARLEAARGQLGSDIEELGDRLEVERNRLRSSLSEVLEWIDEKVQPESALMALRSRAGSPAGGRAESARNGEAEGPADPGAEVLDLRGASAADGTTSSPNGD